MICKGQHVDGRHQKKTAGTPKQGRKGKQEERTDCQM